MSFSETAPPSELSAILERSDALWVAGDLEGALACLKEGQQRLPNSPEIPARLARLLAQSGQLAEALDVSSCALQRDPHCHEARFALGLALFLLERLEEAQAALDRLLTAAPAFPDAAWLRAGLLRRRQGDLSAEVLAAYDQAIRADPRNAYARLERADILRAQGRYAEARDVYASIADALDTANEELRVEAAFKQGCASLTLGEAAAAQAAFRRVLDAAPDYPDAQALCELAAALPRP